MFELSVAFKYLTPRCRQLSVSIISLISILVIALVVWLIVVFFSVTYGLEKSWINKLIALTAPVRVIPTQAYYQSYYYQIDSISNDSNYAYKSIGEKRVAEKSNPYDPEVDEQIPRGWPKPDFGSDRSLKDPVKMAFSIIEKYPELKGADFEMGNGNLHLLLYRKTEKGEESLAEIRQGSFVGTYPSANPNLRKTLLPLTAADLSNLLIHAPDKRLNSFFEKNSSFPQLPTDPILGEGVLLPRSFREVGVRVGDEGTLSYVAPSASSLQEQRTKIFVAGFYDPGIIPLGGKFVLANPGLVSVIRTLSGQEEGSYSNGINVYFDDLDKAPLVKKNLEQAFKEAGIAPYWKIETYREFDFTKDLIQQLRSEKNLFSILATLIIIVACSNIISMLIILVNDKKTEIGILRSMGATSGSIALIFGTCGIVMGVLGSAIGILAAIVTLNNLQSLIGLVSRIQGYELFNSHFYGEALPNELSFTTLGAVIIATAIISLIAGLVPAIKASLLRPSAILRSE